MTVYYVVLCLESDVVGGAKLFQSNNKARQIPMLTRGGAALRRSTRGVSKAKEMKRGDCLVLIGHGNAEMMGTSGGALDLDVNGLNRLLAELQVPRDKSITLDLAGCNTQELSNNFKIKYPAHFIEVFGHPAKFDIGKYYVPFLFSKTTTSGGRDRRKTTTSGRPHRRRT